MEGNRSIFFTAGMNTSQLSSDLEKAKAQLRTISETAKAEGIKVEKSFTDAAESGMKVYNGMTTNLKQQITLQQQLIKEISADIRKYQDQLANTKSPNNNPFSAEYIASSKMKSSLEREIAAAKTALVGANGQLIAMQRMQVDANLKETESQGGIIAGLGKWAAGLFTVAAATEVGKKIIESTEATTHSFEQGIAAAEAATHYFFQSIASGDWSNFTDGMSAAVRGAYEYVDAMEVVNNMSNQDKITSALFDKQIAEEREKTYDKGKDNNAERLKAYNNMIDLTEQKFTPLIETAQKKYDALIKKASSDTGGKTSVDEIDKFISKYRSVKDMIEEGEKYNALKSIKLEAPSRGQFNSTMGNAAEYDKAQAELKLMGEEGQKAGEKAFNISKIIFPVRDAIADAKSDLIGLQKQLEQGNTFIKRSKGSLENKMETDAAAAAKKAKEAEGLDNRIKATKDLMDLAKDANSAEFTALSKKLVMLEAEKKLRESMVDMQMMIAKGKPLEVKGAQSATSAIYEMAKAGGIDLEKLKLKDNDIEVDKLKKGNAAREAEAEKLRKKYHIDEIKDNKELSKSFYDVSDAAGVLSQEIGDSNSGIAELLKGVSKVANEMGNLIKEGAFSKSGMSKGDAISSMFTGATQLIGLVAGQAAENKRIMAEYYASIIAQQQQYNLLLNDQLRLNTSIHDSIFLKNYEGILNDSTQAYNDAQAKYQEELKKFSTSEAITGKKNVVSGSNVIEGAGAGVALGAGIGSIVPGIGTAVGAIVGGAVGLLTGLFAKKKKDIVTPLLEAYPALIKANGDFNDDLAKTLIANNKVTDATKVTLQNLIDWKAAADAATTQMKSVISDLTGSLGNDLRTALVTAFEDGTDSAKAFGTSVDKVLENIMSNIIFNKAFEGAFKTLEDAMSASYAVGGDQSWLDDFQKFYSQSPELIAQFNKGMADAKAAAAAQGFDIFDTTASTITSSGKVSAAITEDTANELVGLWNRTSVDVREILNMSKASSAHLLNIAANTLRTADNTDQLADIKASLKSIDGKSSASRL